MELLMVVFIMITVSTIMVAGYFGMTRTASYDAAAGDIYNSLLLARQRAAMDGTTVYFLLLDTNQFVLVRGVGDLAEDIRMNVGPNEHELYDAYADLESYAPLGTAAEDDDEDDLGGGSVLWNMNNNASAALVNIQTNIAVRRIDPVTEDPYFRMECVITVRQRPDPSDPKKKLPLGSWKAGDRYGIELYPRKLLPKGYWFRIAGKEPECEKIVFHPDGSSSFVDAAGKEQRTGKTALTVTELLPGGAGLKFNLEVSHPGADISIPE